jgi:hypothetical protein
MLGKRQFEISEIKKGQQHVLVRDLLPGVKVSLDKGLLNRLARLFNVSQKIQLDVRIRHAELCCDDPK